MPTITTPADTTTTAQGQPTQQINRAVLSGDEYALADHLLQQLFPICRSITGLGLRATLDILGAVMPMSRQRVASGTPIFDWTVPDEWNIRDAYIAGPDNQRLVDFRSNNLHVVNYSTPIHTRMTRDELEPHLHTLPQQPTAIPYITSYYKRSWGFCLSYEQYRTLGDGPFDVCIDSTLEPGTLDYATTVLPGESDDEVLLSSYCCHPSMANNELSGPITLALLYRRLAKWPQRRFSYRFYLGPKTIGTLCFLKDWGQHLRERCVGGLVATCCGDAGRFTYKRPRTPDRFDQVVRHALEHKPIDHRIIDFCPSGSDERHYCSPGFDLPVGALTRSMYATYPEYHTSLDDLSFVKPQYLIETVDVFEHILQSFEANLRYENLVPYGEPQLRKRGLYPESGAAREDCEYTQRLRWLLSCSDGKHDLLDIAERSGLSIIELANTARELASAALLSELPRRKEHS